MKLLFENWRKFVQEGIDQETGEPDFKYYAFDWDDNLMRMPTKIFLKDDKGGVVGMSTADFATHREKIGKQPFEYNGSIVVDYDENPFRGFRVEGDEDFKKDAFNAPFAPAWNAFREAVNSGSYFAIITARGHSPMAMYETIEEMIEKGHGGLDKKQLLKSLMAYQDKHPVVSNMSPEELLSMYYYKIMQHIYPVSNDEVASQLGGGDAANPEKAKVEAMRRFEADMKKLNDGEFIQLGFSDDDFHNIATMAKAFHPDDLSLFYTGPERKELDEKKNGLTNTKEV